MFLNIFEKEMVNQIHESIQKTFLKEEEAIKIVKEVLKFRYNEEMVDLLLVGALENITNGISGYDYNIENRQKLKKFLSRKKRKKFSKIFENELEQILDIIEEEGQLKTCLKLMREITTVAENLEGREVQEEISRTGIEVKLIHILTIS